MFAFFKVPAYLIHTFVRSFFLYKLLHTKSPLSPRTPLPSFLPIFSSPTNPQPLNTTDPSRHHSPATMKRIPTTLAGIIYSCPRSFVSYRITSYTYTSTPTDRINHPIEPSHIISSQNPILQLRQPQQPTQNNGIDIPQNLCTE